MRTFIIINNGVARVLRTYAFGPGGRSITPGTEGDLPEIVPAPTAIEVIAKYHPDKQAKITGSREITEADLPTDTEHWARDGWEDDGATIIINLAKAKASFEKYIITLKRAKALDILARETAGEDVTSEKATLQAINPQALVAAAPDIAALRAALPAGLIA